MEDMNRKEMMSGLLNWDLVKKNVYPILAASLMEEAEQPTELISENFLDMKIFYIIRLCMGSSEAGYIKISKTLFEHYGISKEVLHSQALKNIEKDGYYIQDMKSVMEELMGIKEDALANSGKETKMENGNLYVFTNKYRVYGAAGILNRNLLREVSCGKSFFILPSSVHETIFVPVEEDIDQKELDKMVTEVNETQVMPEERLTNHSYFYDALQDEIRISA